MVREKIKQNRSYVEKRVWRLKTESPAVERKRKKKKSGRERKCEARRETRTTARENARARARARAGAAAETCDKNKSRNTKRKEGIHRRRTNAERSHSAASNEIRKEARTQ